MSTPARKFAAEWLREELLNRGDDWNDEFDQDGNVAVTGASIATALCEAVEWLESTASSAPIAEGSKLKQLKLNLTIAHDVLTREASIYDGDDVDSTSLALGIVERFIPLAELVLKNPQILED